MKRHFIYHYFLGKESKGSHKRCCSTRGLSRGSCPALPPAAPAPSLSRGHSQTRYQLHEAHRSLSTALHARGCPLCLSVCPSVPPALPPRAAPRTSRSLSPAARPGCRLCAPRPGTSSSPAPPSAAAAGPAASPGPRSQPLSAPLHLPFPAGGSLFPSSPPRAKLNTGAPHHSFIFLLKARIVCLDMISPGFQPHVLT